MTYLSSGCTQDIDFTVDSTSILVITGFCPEEMNWNVHETSEQCAAYLISLSYQFEICTFLNNKEIDFVQRLFVNIIKIET